MIILILLIAVVIAVLAIRGQMRRQHREMMSAVNPERLAAIDAAKRAEARQKTAAALTALGGIVFFIVLVYGCGQMAKFKGFGPNIDVSQPRGPSRPAFPTPAGS